MMTKALVLQMVEEMHEEKKNTQRVPHYYKRHGQMVERSYPDTIYTERYKELFYDKEKRGLRSEEGKIFRCGCCGKMVGYFDLETWICDFEEDDYTCSICYEEGMGDDL